MSPTVLSLFDGMSCGQIALQRAGIPYGDYYASEIDAPAIAVCKHNYPNTKHLGDVTKVSGANLPKIDLLIGGSPCQGFSFAGKMLNFDDPRSKLFFEYARLLKECAPEFFLLENVGMKKESRDVISQILSVEPVEINSSLFSAQNRKRLYWTNIPFEGEIRDAGVLFRDIKDSSPDESLFLKGRGLNKIMRGRNRVRDENCEKAPTLMRAQGGKPTDALVFKVGDRYRYPSRREMELLQTVPVGYTDTLRYNDAASALGNGWTVDVIAHIFKGLPWKV